MLVYSIEKQLSVLSKTQFTFCWSGVRGARRALRAVAGRVLCGALRGLSAHSCAARVVHPECAAAFSSAHRCVAPATPQAPRSSAPLAGALGLRC